LEVAEELKNVVGSERNRGHVNQVCPTWTASTKSSDGGETWTQCRIAEVGTHRQIVVSPKKRRHCFCQRARRALERLADRGLYRTTDGGKNARELRSRPVIFDRMFHRRD